MSKVYKELAGCVILNSEHEILLLHRNTARLAQWELPGGKVELNETPKDAAKREVLEELGVSVHILRELGSTIFSDNGVNWHYTWHQAEIIEGKPKPQEKIHDDCGYFKLISTRLDRSNLSINIVNLIEAIKNGEVRL